MSNFDMTEVRRSIAAMKPDGKLFEVRVVYDNKSVYSGYFRDAEALVSELSKLEAKDCNVYLSLGEINDACYSRKQKDRFLKGTQSTGDRDILRYEWLMIDLDPVRPAMTSASDSEVIKAREKLKVVKRYLTNKGFYEPFVGFSGNGYHLLYRVSINVTDKSKDLVRRFLKTLDALFSDDEVKIDTANYNPARTCKLYGTLAQKGLSTEDRPHRLSKIVQEGDERITPYEYVRKVCNDLPAEPERPQRYNSYSPNEFDIEEWMGKHGLRYEKADYQDGDKYVLECCPFDESHRGKDAAIFRMRSGAIGFKCLHNSCQNRTWRDVRVLFEPDAYERKVQEQKKQAYEKPNREMPKIEIDEPLWYTAEKILTLPRQEETFIRSGITQIDRRLLGLKKGYVSVWSGHRGAAKSTLLSQICLNVVNDGNNVAVFSGELVATDFMRWMLMQAAGKNFVERGMREGEYNVPAKTQRRIASWLGERMWLYNNNHGNKWGELKERLEKAIVEKKLDMVFLDNLMAMNIRELDANKYDAQTQFVLSLGEMAKKYQVHIAFVAHPRKTTGFLRFEDISGTADLGNAVDDAFLVHRINDDFRRLFPQYFGEGRMAIFEDATNTIEIHKDRKNGTQDVFVNLWYEQESKRLKNDRAEYKIYKWCADEFVPATDPMPFD